MTFAKTTISLVFLNLLLSCWWLLNGNLIINFDISRDLMIWHDIIFNRHLTLIGGHSGTIHGVFHGPLWHYINLPAILIGGGDPLTLGWYWILLSILTLVIIFFVAQKLFDRTVALLSILIYSTNSIANFIDESKYFYNPYGAVLLTPLFFYLFYSYLRKPGMKILAICLMVLGLIIQFQIAFGLPILLLTTIYLLIFTVRKKLLLHLPVFLILLIPLSTFILFEIRHDFIQTNTVINYLTTRQSSEIKTWSDFIISRINSLLLDDFKMLLPGNYFLQIIFSIFFFLLLFWKLLKKDSKNRQIYFLFCYFYFGFFLITFFFWGKIVNYYWPFLPLLIIIFCTLLTSLPKKHWASIIFILFIYNFIQGVQIVSSYNPNLSAHSFESWDYNYNMSRIIFRDADSDFGYYIFTPDLFGYTQRYAMEYTDRQFRDKKSYPFVKKNLTYLIMLNPPKDRPDLNPEAWKINEVKITKKPDKIFSFPDYRIEKYMLEDADLQIPSNLNLFLINNLFFR